MIFAIILALKLPFIKQTTNSQNDDYDYLSYGPVNGNFADSDYKNLHEIAKDDFTFGSSEILTILKMHLMGTKILIGYLNKQKVTHFTHQFLLILLHQHYLKVLFTEQPIIK